MCDYAVQSAVYKPIRHTTARNKWAEYDTELNQKVHTDQEKKSVYDEVSKFNDELELTNARNTMMLNCRPNTEIFQQSKKNKMRY